MVRILKFMARESSRNLEDDLRLGDFSKEFFIDMKGLRSLSSSSAAFIGFAKTQ
jgi:hypothetical protein